VFDNDGTLYNYAAGHLKLQHDAAVESVQEFIPNLEEDRIIKLMGHSGGKYGGSLEIFYMEDKYGLSAGQLRDTYYDKLIEKTKGTNFFENTDVPFEKFRQLIDSGVEMAVATHGNMKWALYTYEQTGLDEFFDAENTVTKDMVPYNKKTRPEMFAAALRKLGEPDIKPVWELGEQAVAVEDSKSGLKEARECLNMETIWQYYRPSFDDKIMIPDFVNVQTNSLNETCDNVLWSNMQYGIYPPGQHNLFYTLEN